MPLHICPAGVTGWAGSALARPIAHSSDQAAVVVNLDMDSVAEPVAWVDPHHPDKDPTS